MATRTAYEHGTPVPVRAARAVGRSGLAGAIAMLLSLLACYGALLLIAVLSAFGIALSPDQSLLKEIIVAFALLATASVGFGIRKHGSLLPLLPAAAGAALLSALMIVGVDRLLELLAFLLLVVAVYLDTRLRGRVRCATASELGDD